MSRNGFPDCEREYNRREEAVEMAREERKQSFVHLTFEQIERARGELLSAFAISDWVIEQLCDMALASLTLREELADAKEIEKMRDEEIASVREVAGNATIRFERELAELQNAFEEAVTAREQVEQERDKHFSASKAQNEDITALQAELASYKLWAEVEIADLRDDLSDHIRMAKDAQEDAGRYRWLRDSGREWEFEIMPVILVGDDMKAEDKLDAAIDAAIKRSAT